MQYAGIVDFRFWILACRTQLENHRLKPARLDLDSDRKAKIENPRWHWVIAAWLLLVVDVVAGEAPKWQAEWDRTVRAAEQEGQVSVSIGGYGAIIDSGVFQKTYPKIKITHITGAGTDLTQRISAERRAGKYLVDVYNGGGKLLFSVLFFGQIVHPVQAAFYLSDVSQAIE